MNHYKGRVAIVTGGTYGIGRAISVGLAEMGYHVVAFGLNSEQAGSAAKDGDKGTLSELHAKGLTADLLSGDVRVMDDVDSIVRFAVEKYGRIDALVNNAAIHPSGTAVTTSLSTWADVLDVNLTGMFHCTRAVLPHMLEARRGAIVNIASKASWGQPDLFAYSASKGGVLAASFALAYDHLHDGIRVNVVVPSAVRSGMTERSADFERFAQNAVAGRVTEPEDIAKAVCFLLSRDAEAISGAVLNVNSFAGQGGMGNR